MAMDEYRSIKPLGVPTGEAVPAHLEVAGKMANDILTLSQNPMEQNEMLEKIFNMIKNDRLAKIENAQKEAAYLSESYNKFIEPFSVFVNSLKQPVRQ